MKEVETIRQLDAASRPVPAAPIGDVTGWVLDDIRRAQTQTDDRRVWQIAAVFGAVAAALAIAAVLQVYLSLDNPLADIGLQASATAGNPFAAAPPLHLE